MSILIRGMTMPDSCAECNFESSRGYCRAKPIEFCGHTKDDGRPEWCPLVELPEKHGRLIDADATMKQWGLDKAVKYGNETAVQQDFSYSTMMMYEIANILDEAPAIIEAEGEE